MSGKTLIQKKHSESVKYSQLLSTKDHTNIISCYCYVYWIVILLYIIVSSVYLRVKLSNKYLQQFCSFTGSCNLQVFNCNCNCLFFICNCKTYSILISIVFVSNFCYMSCSIYIYQTKIKVQKVFQRYQHFLNRQ